MATDLSSNAIPTSNGSSLQENTSAIDLVKEPSNFSQSSDQSMMRPVTMDTGVDMNGERDPRGEESSDSLRTDPRGDLHNRPNALVGIDNPASSSRVDHLTDYSASGLMRNRGGADPAEASDYSAFMQAASRGVNQNTLKASIPSQATNMSIHDTGGYPSLVPGPDGGLGDVIKYPLSVPDPILSADMALDDEEDDDEEDDEDEGDEDDEDTESGSKHGMDDMAARKRAQHAITGRGVTLAMLMADKIIQPGPSTMSIDYLGQKFTADLLEDGSIRWKEANKLFNSPSAWAIHCKKIVNPMKKSGCGWASVRYKGKKLDAYKSSWLRKKRPLAMAAMSSLGVSEDEEDDSETKPDPRRIKCDELSSEAGDSISQVPIPVPPLVVKPEKKRLSVKHSTLGRKSLMHDSSTLVECTPFAALGKIQPFSLSVSNTALLSMDFHCHLSSNEVVGYLGGKWDPQSQHLSVERGFACLCHHDDKDAAADVERQIRAEMERSDLTLAGWYHSHPHTQPDPSLRDLEAQIEYQIQMKGSGESIQPCVALIISPYGQDCAGHEESDISAIWAMAPPEHRPLDYGMPMRICYDITEDQGIPKYLLSDMKKQADFHQREPGAINFHDNWHHSGTYHNKLKASLSRKLPHDQEVDKQLLEFLNTLL